jgi:hypothetical protein
MFAMFHFVGQFPEKKRVYSPAYETSLAVVQFFAIATGEVPVHKPANGFRTVRLVGEERYCLGCYGVRWHDVLEAELSAVSGQLSVVKIARCRVCEKVGEA